MMVDTTIVWNHLENSTKRITVEQGGTRSGKTYNILIWLIFSYCARHRNKGKIISIIRESFPLIRGSVMRDFEEIIKMSGIYNKKMHNKSTHEYTVYGNIIEFFSIDNPDKVKGRKRSVLYANEIDRFTSEDWFQLNIRTEEKVILDFNPSMEYHWVYEDVIPRDDCDFFITTYRDNPFLSALQIKEIEMMREKSPWHWTVYGLGKKGKHPNIVFQFEIDKELPKDAEGNILCKKIGTGLDWGFVNDPTACVDVWRRDDHLYITKKIYERRMTNKDINDRLTDLKHPKNDAIYYDNSRQDSGEELRRMGWRTIASRSRTRYNNFGIDIANRFTIHLLAEDGDIIKEFSNYLYKTDAAGKATNEPIDLFNHSIDAFIYVLLMVLGKGTGRYAVQ